VAPTFETHINTPLTHRDPFNSKDPGGVPGPPHFKIDT
jgi:hypothetical protein